MTIRLDHQYIRTNGIRLHVVTAGPENGQPVIMLHGFPEFWYGWRKQIPFLAEQGYRVIAPDQRGYNLSDKPKGIEAYTSNQISADVVGLLDALGYETVVLVGHDWGAAVAWWTALKFPQRLDKLVILNVPHPAVSAQTIGRDLAQTLKSWYIFFFQLPWLPETLAQLNGWQGMVRALRRTSHYGAFSEADLNEYRRAWSQPGAMTAMMNWYRAAGRLRAKMPSKRQIDIPTRVIWGAQDAFIIRKAAQMSLDYLHQGQLFYLENATHWVQHEEAEQVNHLIGEFLAV